MLSKILYRIVRIPILGNRILCPFLIKREGGEKTSVLARKMAMSNNVTVGLYTYGGCFCNDFNVGGSVTIGRYCSIAKHVHYFGANHPMEKAIMSPYFYNKSFGYAVKDVQRSSLVVGNDVWIGEGVIITNSCKSIGDGVVIGAGSIVTKDIPPYAVVAGNPARIINYRFSEEIIQELMASHWWYLSPSELMEYYEMMNQPQLFAKKIVEFLREGENDRDENRKDL